MKKMHPKQELLLELSKRNNFNSMSLRQIGKLINADNSPQVVKFHLMKLVKDGHLNLEKKMNFFDSINQMSANSASFLNIPVLGEANCGQATIFSNQEVKGYLRVSRSLISKRSGSLFAVKAVGDSMNNSDIDGKAIVDGSYVVIDGQAKNISNGDYVLSVIDGCANIKRFYRESAQRRVVLRSESKNQDLFPPIIIGENENYLINGKVIFVV